MELADKNTIGKVDSPDANIPWPTIDRMYVFMFSLRLTSPFAISKFPVNSWPRRNFHVDVSKQNEALRVPLGCPEERGGKHSWKSVPTYRTAG